MNDATREYEFESVGESTIRETWRASAPADLKGDDLAHFLEDEMREGRAEFVDESNEEENGRELVEGSTTAQIRLDIGATAHEITEWEARGVELRKRLGSSLAEARDHPELTLEEGRKLPEKEIPRQSANRLIREATGQHV
jgi:hypothetical protein